MEVGDDIINYGGYEFFCYWDPSKGQINLQIYPEGCEDSFWPARFNLVVGFEGNILANHEDWADFKPSRTGVIQRRVIVDILSELFLS